MIAWIPQSIAAMLLSSGIGPRYPILHLLDKDGESQQIDIAQQLLNRALRKAMKKQACAEVFVTDRLRSYGAALNDLGAAIAKRPIGG